MRKSKPGKSKSKSKSKAPEAPRTPRLDRVRYVEPPTKSDGNPFVAFRCNGKLLRAFKAWARKSGTTLPDALRAYMGELTGVGSDEEGGE